MTSSAGIRCGLAKYRLPRASTRSIYRRLPQITSLKHAAVSLTKTQKAAAEMRNYYRTPLPSDDILALLLYVQFYFYSFLFDYIIDLFLSAFRSLPLFRQRKALSLICAEEILCITFFCRVCCLKDFRQLFYCQQRMPRPPPHRLLDMRPRRGFSVADCRPPSRRSLLALTRIDIHDTASPPGTIFSMRSMRPMPRAAICRHTGRSLMPLSSKKPKRQNEEPCRE